MENKINRYITYQVFVLIAILFPLCGGAQPLSLADAVDRAVANYPLMQQRKSEVAAGQAHLNTVRGSHLPTLLLQDQFDLGSTNPLQGAYFSMGIVPSTPGGNPSAKPNYNPDPVNLAITSLQWEFYNFGYYKAQQRQAQAQLAVNEANLGSDRYMIKERVIALYLDWLKKYRLLQIQNENLQRAQVILTSIRATVLSGLKPGVDSSTASAAYADAQIAYLQTQDEYNYDKIAIAVYTGTNAAVIMPDTNFVSATILGSKAPQLADTVNTDHPLLNVYEKQYEQQLADNRAISRKYMPRVSLNSAAWVKNSGISYTGTYPDNLADGLPYNKYNYVVGLSATYNLFDLRHKHDQLVEGRYLVDAKESALQTEQLNLNRMLQQANSAYATTVEKIRVIPVQLNSARQAYSQQYALYRSGLNTLIEVTNAQYALLQAETNYVIAQDELLQLLYIRAGLAGQLDIFLQNSKR